MKTKNIEHDGATYTARIWTARETDTFVSETKDDTLLKAYCKVLVRSLVRDGKPIYSDPEALPDLFSYEELINLAEKVYKLQDPFFKTGLADSSTATPK
jgi:hypothetical protein